MFTTPQITAKSLLHWSVIHYQVTFEWHSGRGLETSPGLLSCLKLYVYGQQLYSYQDGRMT